MALKPNHTEEIKEIAAYWQNDLDAKKYLIQVHNRDFSKVLGEDYKLATLTDQERQFIMDMVSIGQMALDIVPVPDIAHEIKEMDFLSINTIAILKFNVQNNMIVDRTTGWKQEQTNDEEIGDNSWIEKMSKRISGKAKPTKLPDTD